MLPSASEHYQRQQRITAAILVAVRSEWATIGADFDAGWAKAGPRILALVIAGQLASAREGLAYVPRSLEDTGEQADPVGGFDARAFAGYASDGRELDTLLYGAVTTAKGALSGASTVDALAVGRRWLDMTTSTQLVDAGRSATGVGVTARPAVKGSVRVLNPPSCGRCAVLAGRFYRWSSGFRRHPRCDCFHRPGSPQPGDLTDPQAYFDGLPASEQDRLFGKAQAQAIRDGADIGQVVNASRSTYTAGGRTFTRDGVTVRGRYGSTAPALERRTGSKYRTSKVARITPEQIYRDAVDRDDAIRLLKRFGYLT